MVAKVSDGFQTQSTFQRLPHGNDVATAELREGVPIKVKSTSTSSALYHVAEYT